MATREYTLEELQQAAKPRPESHGIHFLHCVGCTVPTIRMERREDGNYVITLNGDVYIYLDSSQLESFRSEMDTKLRAAVDEG